MSRPFVDSYRRRFSGNKATRARRLLLEHLTARTLLAADILAGVVMDDSSALGETMAATAMHATGNHDHTCAVAHPNDPALASEHCAALMLATPEAATHLVVQSGDWSDSEVWKDGELPTEGSRAYIPANLSLRVDGVIETTLQSLRIDGTLRFDPRVNTELRVDTLVGAPGSTFEMGTEMHPIEEHVSARIVVADTGEIDRDFDPRELGRGLILHGTSRMHGAAKTSWTSIRGGIPAGNDRIVLPTVPTGWQVGDSLVIAGTRMDATGEEVVRIASIDGPQVVFDRPLEVDHIPPAKDLSVHIANTSRNAVIESESAALHRRGHVMFMHSRDVEIAFAGFYDLGRTNKLDIVDDAVLTEDGQLESGTGTNVRGRYSVHFHRNGVTADSPSAKVVGSAVVGSPGWGYVNHSSYVDMIDNVSYNVNGAAFNTEAGDEIGSFINNLSIKTHGTGGSPVERQEAQDFGHAGDGFWFQGPGITVEGNVASGATGSGLIIYADGLIDPGIGKVGFRAENLDDPSLANGAETVPVVLTPIKNFANNTAYGSMEGLRMYYHRTLVQLEDDEGEQLAQYQWQFPDSVIEGTVAWNNRAGARLNYTLDTVFRNARIVNADDQVGEIGFDVTNVYNRGRHTYQDFQVAGFETGVIPSPNGEVIIDGGLFDNQTDFLVLEPRQTHRRMEFKGDIQFASDPESNGAISEQRNIVMQADPRIVVDSFENWFLLHDRVILNFGEYDGQQLYFHEQAAEHVVFTEPPEQATPDDPGPEVDEQFIGLTNSELQMQFGTSFGGNLIPADAADAPDDGIVGMIGSAAPNPGPLPDPEEEPDDDPTDEEPVDECEEDEDDHEDAPEDEEEDCEHDPDSEENLPELDEEDPESDNETDDEDMEPDENADDGSESDEEDANGDSEEDGEENDEGDQDVASDNDDDEIEDVFHDEQEPDDSIEEPLSSVIAWFHNNSYPTDVNSDQFVSTIDALLIINRLNSEGSRQLAETVQSTVTAFVDVDRNGFLSPADALLVVNELNTVGFVAEGESSSTDNGSPFTGDRDLDSQNLEARWSDRVPISGSSREFRNPVSGPSVSRTLSSNRYARGVDLALEALGRVASSARGEGMASLASALPGRITSDLPHEKSEPLVRFLSWEG